MQSFFPVGRLSLDEFPSIVINYLKSVEFAAVCCLIKELTSIDGVVRSNSPSKIGKEKFQAFLFKRKGDDITNNNGDYVINGVKFNLNFTQYQVHIVTI